MEKRERTEGGKWKNFYKMKTIDSPICTLVLRKLVNWRKEKEEWYELGWRKQITEEEEWKRGEEKYIILLWSGDFLRSCGAD